MACDPARNPKEDNSIINTKNNLISNEYFEGKVKSISFNGRSLPSSVGVMSVGEYTFDTQAKETMTVIAGTLKVKFPGVNIYETFHEGQAFEVEANSSFELIVEIETAYLCQYHQ